MYKNLFLNEQGGFTDFLYWSSSELEDNRTWSNFFKNGATTFGDKNYGCHVRAAKAFPSSKAVVLNKGYQAKQNWLLEPIENVEMSIASYNVVKK